MYEMRTLDMIQKLHEYGLPALVIILIAVLMFAAGYQAAKRVDMKSDTKTNVVDNSQTETNKHRTIETTTTIDKNTGKTVIQSTVTENSDTVKQDNKQIATEIKTETLAVRPRTNVSALFGTSIHDLQPIYGISVTQEVLGPVTLGAFGMSNGTVGLSLGWSF